MLTYVINTSENKTFDSSTLFEITGYNKIRWMHCPLNEISDRAKEIAEKQNVLGADQFRIAVIIDFYNFDRVRTPYGRAGFVEDAGVDMSIYMPYIEAYLMDNLVMYLEKKDLFVSDFEVYYVQNEKSERFDLFENARGQLEKILTGDEPATIYTTEDMRARRAAEKAVKRLSTKTKTKGVYPDINDIKCRKTEKWSRINMVWQKSDVVVSMPFSAKWAIRDSEPNEHLIYSDGVLIGSITTEEPAPQTVVKKLRSEHFTVGKVTLDYDLRIVEEDDEYIYRYMFIFSFFEGEHQNFAYIELNYDQVDEDALKEHMLPGILVSSTEDRSFDGKFLQVNEVFYKSFTLHCTRDVQLRFKLTDFPYGAYEMTFTQFWKAFCQRQSMKMDMKRHYYIVPYGGGSSRAALDTLSLSLYLIRMYEREEISISEGNMEVFHLDSEVLRTVLEDSWRKVNTAKSIAKSEKVKFYSLIQPGASKTGDILRETSFKEFITKERFLLNKAHRNDKSNADRYYSKIGDIIDRDLSSLTAKNRHDFDVVMTKYLEKRDETKASYANEEVIGINSDLELVDKCPSKEEYIHILKEKEEEVSKLFEKTLSSEFIQVDYTEERERADEAYIAYKNAQACLHRNIIGDLIFMVLAIAVMIVPYIVFQLTSYKSPVFSSTVLGLYMTCFFGAAFLLAVSIQMIPLVRTMNKNKWLLKRCYIDCCAKENYAFSAIKRKFEKNLIDIEQARYDIRQIKRIYTANIAKERNITEHRAMLERLEDCLSGILNNLDVEPAFTLLESLDGELDLSKPVQDKSNRIYHVFSIETIEKMFPKKGRD